MAVKEVKVPLTEPIMTHKGELSEITLKAPRAGLFMRHGEPFVTDVDFEAGKVKHVYDNKIMSKFLADMSGFDEIVLGNLSTPDFYVVRSEATQLILGLAGRDFSAA